MARCSRCNKFMFFSTKSGYCKDCDIIVAKNLAKKEQDARIEAEKRLREEMERRTIEKREQLAEEERRRQEEAEQKRKAEEERRLQEEAEQKRKAEEERRLQEEAERKRKAEEERRRQEETEQKRKAEEERRRQEEAEQKRKQNSVNESKQNNTSSRAGNPKEELEAIYQEGLKYFTMPTIDIAVKYFLRAASEGLPIAQTQIGMMYLNGLGVPKNMPLGVSWMKKAASQEYPMAEANLASCYYYGNGVVQDKAQAFKLYKSASEHGDEFAQYMLGMMYKNGESVPQNDAIARDYFLKATANGSSDAFKEIIGDDARNNLRGSSQCNPIVKEEFHAFLSFIKKTIKVQDTYVSQDNFNVAIAAKRGENYVKANRMYALLCASLSALSSNVAVAWLKVLAATGAVKDAIILGEYMLAASNVQHEDELSWQLLENNVSTLKNLVNKHDWPGLQNRIMELAGGYGSQAIRLDDVDVYTEYK